MRDWVIYAFVQGFWERLTEGDSFGRTHETNQDWNEAYDRGANVADWFRRDSDTRRMAETPKSGSVRSTGSAGLKGIAQGPSHEQ